MTKYHIIPNFSSVPRAELVAVHQRDRDRCFNRAVWAAEITEKTQSQYRDCHSLGIPEVVETNGVQWTYRIMLQWKTKNHFLRITVRDNLADQTCNLIELVEDK